jgi:hypothetical protein
MRLTIKLQRTSPESPPHTLLEVTELILDRPPGRFRFASKLRRRGHATQVAELEAMTSGATIPGSSPVTPMFGRRSDWMSGRGLLYLPVSTPSNDFYGGNRPGNNLFGETLVCMDANTGAQVALTMTYRPRSAVSSW